MRGGRVRELGRNDVAELLLEHVQEQLVEGSLRALSQSVQLLHVIGENASLEISSNPHSYIRIQEVVEPFLSLLRVVEGNELFLHRLVRSNVVLNQIGGLSSQLPIIKPPLRHLVSGFVVGVSRYLVHVGDVDVVVDPANSPAIAAPYSQEARATKQSVASRYLIS